MERVITSSDNEVNCSKIQIYKNLSRYLKDGFGVLCLRHSLKYYAKTFNSIGNQHHADTKLHLIFIQQKPLCSALL